MQKNKKIWAIIVIAIALFSGLVYFILKDNVSDSDVTKPKGNLVTFNGADLNETTDGKVIWSVKAEKIEYDPKTKDVYLTNLTGTFNKDNTTLTVTAPRGRMTDNRKNMDMAGGVKGSSTDGASFETDTLHFDNTKKLLTSESAFTYTKDDMTITGDKLEGDMTMEVIKAIGNAKLVKEEK